MLVHGLGEGLSFKGLGFVICDHCRCLYFLPSIMFTEQCSGPLRLSIIKVLPVLYFPKFCALHAFLCLSMFIHSIMPVVKSNLLFMVRLYAWFGQATCSFYVSIFMFMVRCLFDLQGILFIFIKILSECSLSVCLSRPKWDFNITSVCCLICLFLATGQELLWIFTAIK